MRPKRDLRPVLLPILSLLFLLSLIGCRTTGGSVGIDWGSANKYEKPGKPPQAKRGGPPAHAPAHGYRAKHQYRYYPDVDVYFDIQRKVYFYIDGGTWRMSVTLPHAIRLGDAYVSIEMETDKPYRYHRQHKAKYPPGKMKAKKNKGDWAKK